MSDYISIPELEKIEQLLDSKVDVNIQLGLTLLSNFAIDETGAKWLWNYYHQLIQREKNETPSWDFNQIYTTGTLDSQPSKASYVLTILLEQAPIPFCLQMLNTFIHHTVLTLPRNELTTLPDYLLTYPNIEYFVFPYGNLEKIPATIKKMTHLKVLDLRHQPLSFIHPNIGLLPKLEELWIRNAAFISDDIREIPHLDIYVEGAY